MQFAELKKELESCGAVWVDAVDISSLSETARHAYPRALLVGLALSPDYLLRASTEDSIDHQEFFACELAADRLSEWAANCLHRAGYQAYAQSEKNNQESGAYDPESKSTPLPHKTIAILAGLGWIGKSNLLVTKEFGSAICLGTVLTDAPLPAHAEPPLAVQCGDCIRCREVCPAHAIVGNDWERGCAREDIADIFQCESCLKCLVLCPWTQTYMRRAQREAR